MNRIEMVIDQTEWFKPMIAHQPEQLKMAQQPVQSSRIQRLNDRELNKKGKYVLYWMQQSQRAAYNHALEYAVQQANSI
jgi:hypothetical protein